MHKEIGTLEYQPEVAAGLVIGELDRYLRHTGWNASVTSGWPEYVLRHGNETVTVHATVTPEGYRMEIDDSTPFGQAVAGFFTCPHAMAERKPLMSLVHY